MGAEGDCFAFWFDQFDSRTKKPIEVLVTSRVQMRDAKICKIERMKK